MRCFVLAAALLFSTSVFAEFTPDAVAMPKPLYPSSLISTQGHARISLKIHSDGTVSDVKALSATQPAFGEAAVAAATLWRFKPWTVDQDRPAEREVVAPMVFRLDQSAPLHTNKLLTKLRCHAVNEDARRYPESAWVDMPAFSYTRSYLSNTFNSAQLSNEQRLALIARLNERVPIIVRRCGDSPLIRFMSLLPEEIKKLL